MQSINLPSTFNDSDWYYVLLDGTVVGRLSGVMCEDFTKKLRYLKAKGGEDVSFSWQKSCLNCPEECCTIQRALETIVVKFPIAQNKFLQT